MSSYLHLSLPETVRRAASAVYVDLPLEGILVTVRHPATSEIAQFERYRTPGTPPQSVGAVVSQPLLLDGRSIGKIELQASPSARAALLLRAADALQDEIMDTLKRSRPRRAA